MSDLIDRQMVIDAVLRVAKTCPAEFENSGDAKMGYIAAIQSIYHELKAISPTLPELIYCRDCRNWEQINKALRARPEVIRCRDCKHWVDYDGFNHEHGAQCELINMWMQQDDYCSYAKKREGSDGNTDRSRKDR